MVPPKSNSFLFSNLGLTMAQQTSIPVNCFTAGGGHTLCRPICCGRGAWWNSLSLEVSLIWFSSVQLLSRVQFFATPWTTARQTSLSITNSRSLPRLMLIKSVMPSNHLILCRPLLLLSSKAMRLVSPKKSLRACVWKVFPFLGILTRCLVNPRHDVKPQKT